MVRRVIEIDREKCNGCGACADACHLFYNKKIIVAVQYLYEHVILRRCVFDVYVYWAYYR